MSGLASSFCRNTPPTSTPLSRSSPSSKLCCERPGREVTKPSPTPAAKSSPNIRPPNAPHTSRTQDTRRPKSRTLLGGCPQTSGGEEIVGKRMPEPMSLRLDEPAHGKKAEAVVLAVCVDPLDALAQGVHGLACLARHPLPPRFETDGLLVALADAPRQAGQFDVVPVARRRRKDADWACDMIGERDDVLARGVARVDQEPVGRLAVAASDVVAHRPR